MGRTLEELEPRRAATSPGLVECKGAPMTYPPGTLQELDDEYVRLIRGLGDIWNRPDEELDHDILDLLTLIESYRVQHKVVGQSRLGYGYLHKVLRGEWTLDELFEKMIMRPPNDEWNGTSRLRELAEAGHIEFSFEYLVLGMPHRWRFHKQASENLAQAIALADRFREEEVM